MESHRFSFFAVCTLLLFLRFQWAVCSCNGGENDYNLLVCFTVSIVFITIIIIIVILLLL